MKTLLRRFLFTILMLFLFGIVGILTNTYVAAISNHWLDRLGFAPIDLLALDLFRLFTSALVTAGGPVFWEILRLTAFGVGLSEWLTGTRRAALTFWGIHSTTLVLELLVCALPLQSIGMKFGSLVALSRDVGPSAGYFGALGLVSALFAIPGTCSVAG